MNLTREQLDTLHRLASSVIDGTIQSAEFAELTALLETSAAARDFYARYMSLQTALVRAIAATDAGRPILSAGISESASVPLAHPGDSPSGSPVLGVVIRVTSAIQRPVVWSVLAAGILFVSYFAAISWNMLGREAVDRRLKAVASSSGSDLPPTAHSLPPDADAVATITASEDAQWSDTSPHLSPRGRGAGGKGASLQPHEPLAITSGLVELQLKQGTTLVIEGPAEWTIEGDNAAKLNRGKLVARVPREAVGFTLDTPSAKIVDLGTEFGVEVQSDGNASVHVLDGNVNIASSQFNETPVRVHKGEAVNIDTRTAIGAVPFDARRFVTSVAANNEESQSSPISLAGLRLWLRADRGVTLDQNNRVERWADQSGNGFDATQQQADRRPTLEKSLATATIPAVQFDGKGSFLECSKGLNLDVAKDLTILVAFTALGEFERNRGLFSLRSRIGTDWKSPDGLSFSQQVGDTGGAEILFLYGSLGKPQSVQAAIPPAMPLILTFTKRGQVTSLRFNGATATFGHQAVMAAETPASMNQAGYCLGVRYDNGRGLPGYAYFGKSSIAEVLVYDRALEGGESAAVERGIIARPGAKSKQPTAATP